MSAWRHYDRCEEADYHRQHGLSERGHVQSGDREEKYAYETEEACLSLNGIII